MSTIIVTGATGDIGKAIADAFEARGDTVVRIGHSTAPGTIAADVSDPASIAALVESLPESADWLVTAHGWIDAEMDFTKQSLDAIERTFAVNVYSQILLAQALLPRVSMGIVMISSTSGVSPNGKVLAYSASKAAVNALAQGMARNRSDKRFFALCPGPTLGRMRASIGAHGGQPPAAVADATIELVTNETYKSGDVVTVKDGTIDIVSRI